MLNYWNRQDNPATFETLDEVRKHAPEVTNRLAGSENAPRIPNPLLENFPAGLLYVYRSPNIYGGETAARNNTTFVVFPDGRFETKEAAKAYLENLGLIKNIDEAVGTILLIQPEKAAGYGECDLQYCYTLFNALFCEKAFVEVDGKRCVFAEAEYCGGYGKTYMFGEGKGATFMNNYVAGSRDELIGRVAGYFTYGGEMCDEARVSQYVPAFLVNACGVAVQKFRRANKTNAFAFCEGISRFYNQNIPLRQVRTAKDEKEGPGFWMDKAFRSMFMFLQRTANVMTKYLEPRVTNRYQGYVPAPPITRYALSKRNPILNGRALVGDLEVIFRHDTERFSEYKSLPGDFAIPGAYLDTWYEVLPQNVLNNTAPAHSVPLLLANHGGGDDHLMFLDETGILLTAGEKGFAVVAPMHSGITTVAGEAHTRLVQYMLDTYPALDPERVWVTGYSMGGWASYHCMAQHPEVYSAAIPMAMPLRPKDLPEKTEEIFSKYDLPSLLISSTYDFAAWDSDNNHLNEGGEYFLQNYSRFNGIEPVEEFDYEAYPVIGRPYDSFSLSTVNGEWRNGEWLVKNKGGVPMLGLNVTEYLQHSLWPGYGDIIYNFAKHYRRSKETGEIIYTE
ncbi:MAG: alpha/beta hydrolase [Eubacterium sp.]|nr:alpha/beta hydrolase [Eubacterium sp.]